MNSEIETNEVVCFLWLCKLKNLCPELMVKDFLDVGIKGNSGQIFEIMRTKLDLESFYVNSGNKTNQISLDLNATIVEKIKSYLIFIGLHIVENNQGIKEYKYSYELVQRTVGNNSFYLFSENHMKYCTSEFYDSIFKQFKPEEALNECTLASYILSSKFIF